MMRFAGECLLRTACITVWRSHGRMHFVEIGAQAVLIAVPLRYGIFSSTICQRMFAPNCSYNRVAVPRSDALS